MGDEGAMIEFLDSLSFIEMILIFMALYLSVWVLELYLECKKTKALMDKGFCKERKNK